MSTFELTIVSMDEVYFRGPAEFLAFPGLDGEQGVLPQHETMIAAVKAGELRFTANGKTEILVVGDGFVEILGDKVTLICDFATHADQIDLMRAQRAKERAEERIKAKKSEQEYIHSQAALARAMARIKVSSKARKSM